MDNPATQTNGAVDEAAQQPSDASNIRALLSSMGAEDYEPRVVNQLLDFMYKYVTDTLLDAEVSWCSMMKGSMCMPGKMAVHMAWRPAGWV